jgi:hypothetical protein
MTDLSLILVGQLGFFKKHKDLRNSKNNPLLYLLPKA